MKIALIGSTSSSLINFRRRMIVELISRGYEVHAFACDYDEESRIAVRKIGAIPSDYTLGRGLLNPITFLKALFLLRKALVRGHFPYVISYFVQPSVMTWMALLLIKNVKQGVLLEGMGYAFTQRPEPFFLTLRRQFIRYLVSFIYKKMFTKLSRIVVLNKDDKLLVRSLLNKSDDRLKLVEGIGVDIGTFSEMPEPDFENPVFGYIGRLLKDKGVNDFIIAAGLVKAKYPDARFVIMGDCDFGNPSSITHYELKSLVDNGVIEYRGFEYDISRALESITVLVLPSYREGLSRVLQEALASGRPVIATTAPGSFNSFRDHIDGRLYRTGDVEQLSEIIQSFILNPLILKSYSNSARAYAIKKYDEKTQSEKLVSALLKPLS